MWSFLFTFGISGILSFFAYGTDYIYKDYFHTPGFKSEIEQYVSYLSIYEINDTSLEEAKRAITVSDEEINEHRYRYGDLPEQIANIQAQYEDRIQEAEAIGNDTLKATYVSERDAKIKDITKNFESDDYVKEKVRKDKEKEIEKYYKERKNFISDPMKYYKGAFHYYFYDKSTEKVYTNIKPSDDEAMEQAESLYLTNYTITRDDFFAFGPYYQYELIESIVPEKIGPLEGKIWVPESIPKSNFIMQEFEQYRQKQIIFIGITLISILALVISIIVARRSKAIPSFIEKWRPYYNKLPIDLRIIFLACTAVGTIIAVVAAINWFNEVFHDLFFAFLIFIGFLIASFCFALTFFQWKFIVPKVKDWKSLKGDMQKSLLYKIGKHGKRLSDKIAQLMKEAFLNQSTGTQLFILLGAVFVLGFTPILVLVHPVYIFFYVLMLVFIGIPILLILVKNIGYFNRIIEKTDELAAGILGPDLPITGRSVFATLAGNINVLKQGVRTSLSEQAKSERLKTELITNVSHDLRTPLTSIITYTELLKKEDISSEERDAYLEIIDRKSKRLKVLIDDLFEVSKMASGNIQLSKEKVDLVQLLQQALAEYDNAINESSLQFRVSNPEKPVYALVDGQKLWRVFDNLIGNILKYSLENSRVYITVGVLNGQVAIMFKNVSKYELSDNSDELFERFKRGDTSRNTDGSGLGLAIAKSIVDLHEGSLDIETDGDLFKVKIMLDVEL